MLEIVAVPPQQLLERILTLEVVRVTERAAVSDVRLRGHGNKIAADQAAVVIGEGDRDKAPIRQQRAMTCEATFGRTHLIALALNTPLGVAVAKQGA